MLVSTIEHSCLIGCVCFGCKSLPEMLFRKWGCLVGPENSIFRKLKSVDPKKMPLTTEISLHFYFPFKAFPENERERERESARVRERRSVERRDRAIDRNLAVARSRSTAREEDPRSRSTLRKIAPSIAISDRDRLSSLMIFFLGCGLCFSRFVFSFFFSKHQKYFPENFLKCNQTQRNIFLFRKLAFPENMYFLENILRQPNTA